MPRALLLLLCFSAAALHGQVIFYNGSWINDPSPWTVEAGTPIAVYGGSGLGNSGTLETRLSFNNPPTVDYYVETGLANTQPDPGDNALWIHYLRNSNGNYYKVIGPMYAGTLTVSVFSGGTETYLASVGMAKPESSVKSWIAGNTIRVYVDGVMVLTLQDNTLSSGNPGVGTQYTYGGQYGQYSMMGNATLGRADVTPPSIPAGLTGTAFATKVPLTWNASTDNSTGIAGYKVYRQLPPSQTWQLLTVSPISPTSFVDLPLVPVTAYNFAVTAVDNAGNESNKSTTYSVTTLPSTAIAPDEGGPVDYASTWGAGPEKISLLTGVLAFRLPLAKLQHRGPGPGFQLTAGWNSQFWSQLGSPLATTMSAIDVGYGLGVTFQIAAVYPVFQGTNLIRFDLQDGVGVIHKLLPTGTAYQYKTQDSTYLTWNYAANPPTLTFNDGTVWSFGCESVDPEADAGTLYPTSLKDSNGNIVQVIYMPGSGLTAAQTNTSGRIKQINDSKTQYNWTYTTVNGAPHVSQVSHAGTVDAAFSFTTTTLISPFDGTSYGTKVLLASVTFTGLPSPYVFSYNSSGAGYTGEITKIKFPYHGYFRYEYVTASFSSNTRKIREVGARYMCALPAGNPLGSSCAETEQGYSFSHPSGDSSLPAHTQTTVVDAAGNKKVWDFINGSSAGWDNGMESLMRTYQGTGTDLKLSVNTYWTQDDTNSQTIKNPRAWKVVTTLEDGATKSMRQQDVDANGNVSQVREYGYYTGSDPSTPYRTTTTTYLGGTNYTSRNILNRPTQVTVCAGAAGCGTPASQVTYTYDSYPWWLTTCAVTGGTTFDANYGYTFIYRGNVTSSNTNGLITGAAQVDYCGNVRQTSDGSCHVLATTTLNSFNQVSSVSGGGHTSTMTYESSGSGLLSTTTGSNGDTVLFGYSSYRLTQVTNPDNSVRTMSYSDTYPATRTGNTPLGRVSKTVSDGFGRVLKSAIRESTSPEVWIVTETQYEACSCSTTGKTKKTSRPYRANSSLTATETVYWNNSTFDALGRPTQITLPDGKYTTYAYGIENQTLNGVAWLGTKTTITDPSGKQKRNIENAFGQLVRVDEGTSLPETARYTYDIMGRMTQVGMRKADGSYTQTRTFVYNTQGQLTSATNPENGTVTYSYRTDGLLQSKTDAKNQVLNYIYDNTTHQLTAVQNSSGQNLTTFRYGTTSDPAGWKANGRLVSATNQNADASNVYTWWHAYDSMGRVSKQTLVTPKVWEAYPYGNHALQAQYTFDGDGRLTQIKYPGTTQSWNNSSQPTDNLNTDGVSYAYSFNILGQQTSMQMYSSYYEAWITQAWGGTYNASGQITAWNQGDETGYSTFSRGYNAARGWMTSTSSSAANSSISYNYFDNGRVQSATEYINGGQGVTHQYQYDNLNRLTQATTPTWGMSWTYDEYGNRLSQTGTGTASGMTQTLTYNSATNRILTPSYFNNYDANGNLLVGAADLSLTYDIFDRVKQATKAGNTYQYAYDAFGRRVAKTDPSGAVTVMFNDVNGRLLNQGGGNPNFNIVYFAGQRLGQFTDRVGNVRYTPGVYSHYYPYGEEITSTGNDRYKFAETFRDSDTGLDYAINRYYSSSTGRFLTTDPLGKRTNDTCHHLTTRGIFSLAELEPNTFVTGEPQSLNRYAYVKGDPINYSDPLGLLAAPVECGGGGGDGGGDGGEEEEKGPDCWVQLKYRKADAPLRQSHIYLWVQDRLGVEHVLEGDREGVNLVARDTPSGIAKDRPRKDSEQGQGLRGKTADGRDVCDIVDRMIAAVHAFSPMLYGYPLMNGPVSNTVTHWLLQKGGVASMFDAPPGSYGWDFIINQ